MYVASASQEAEHSLLTLEKVPLRGKLLFSLSQYVKIFAAKPRLIVASCQLPGFTDNQKPTTDNQKLKVIIAAGLTSSHLEQRS